MSAWHDEWTRGELDIKLVKYADVSTLEIEEADCALLVAEAPYCVAAYEYGAFFCTTAGEGLVETIDMLDRLGDFGFSDRFLEIMLQITMKGVSYVRFDTDGYSLHPKQQKVARPKPTVERTDLQRVLGTRRVGSSNIPES